MPEHAGLIVARAIIAQRAIDRTTVMHLRRRMDARHHPFSKFEDCKRLVIPIDARGVWPRDSCGALMVVPGYPVSRVPSRLQEWIEPMNREVAGSSLCGQSHVV